MHYRAAVKFIKNKHARLQGEHTVLLVTVPCTTLLYTSGNMPFVCSCGAAYTHVSITVLDFDDWHKKISLHYIIDYNEVLNIATQTIYTLSLYPEFKYYNTSFYVIIVSIDK